MGEAVAFVLGGWVVWAAVRFAHVRREWRDREERAQVERMTRSLRDGAR